MRTLLLALLLLPASALAHGQYTESATDVSPGYPEPNVAEIEAAIASAAGEFGVPESLLRAVAHTEGRWHHLPYRISAHGRRGLFSLTAERITDASSILNEDPDAIIGDYVTHTRAFAALLDDARPLTSPMPPVGEWRDALAWSLQLAAGAADQYADRVMGIVNDGVIDQLPTTGEPITIAPEAVDGQYLGVFEGMVERSSDYPGAVWNPAASCNYSNYSRTPGDVDKIIIHTAQGTYAGTISWFQNCAASVSAHYVVSSQGDITQMVEEEDVGWHVSCWNGRSIGIEHEGYVSQPSLYYTTAMYNATADLVTDMLTDWGLPTDRNTVLGHVEIDPACNGNSHSDPGTGWDWDLFMGLMGSTNPPPPPDPTNLVGYIRHTDLYESAYGIAGATVDGGALGTAVTSASGYYSFNDIQAGTYTVCADATGYQQGCTSKVVAPEITNWGSILLTEEPVGDDDDSTPPVDDDDTVADDDDAADDDDSTPPVDDDDTADDDDSTPPVDDDDTVADDDDAVDDDDAADENPVYGGSRHSVLDDGSGDGPERRGCTTGCSAGAGAAGLPALFLILGLRRRRS